MASNEGWRVCAGFPDYEISESGCIRRLTQGGRRYPIGYELKPKDHQRGYKYYILHSNGKSYTRLVHRLVALSWIGEPKSKDLEVAHKDGSRTNNHWRNLRWSTAKENQSDRKLHGTYHAGEKASAAKLADAQTIEIRKRYAQDGRRYVGGKISMQDLSEHYGVSVAQISRIVNGHQRSTQLQPSR